MESALQPVIQVLAKSVWTHLPLSGVEERGTASHRATLEQFLMYVGMASLPRKQLQTKLELSGHAL